jgi:hypothetical protein
LAEFPKSGDFSYGSFISTLLPYTAAGLKRPL